MADAPPLVLFAEDDDEDWLLISEVLEDECKSEIRHERVKDGVSLLDRLHNPAQPLPHLIMLDIRMPRKDGVETLREIRQDPVLRHIPVVIMTTSKGEMDVMRAYTSGANAYVVKPVSFPDMAIILKSLHHYWTEILRVPDPSLVARPAAVRAA
jgi:CheY-like chemotaxis protein